MELLCIRKPRLDVNNYLKVFGWQLHIEVEAPVQTGFINASVYGIEEKLFAVHSAGTMIRSVACRPKPLEVANHIAGDSRMNVGGLMDKGWTHRHSRNGVG